MARSALPSPLKSPVRTSETISGANVIVVGAPNPPVPLPNRTEASVNPSIARSSLLSPLKSASTASIGCVPAG